MNQLYEDRTELCDFCKSRRNMQQRNLGKIRDIFQDKFGKKLVEVPLFKDEIREYNKLKEFGDFLIK